MQKQKLLAVLSFVLVVVMLVAMGGNTVTATPAQTMAATMAMPAATMAAAAPVPNTGMIKGGLTGEAQTLTGTGSTFAAPLYTKWFADYAKLTGVQINYKGTGSGVGISSIQGETVDFGASDGIMSDTQIAAAKGGPVLHIATALGGVSIVYNVPEATDPIKLTGDNLTLIYLGNNAANFKGADGNPLTPLLMWNDPRLVADNPGLANVAKNIFVVHRADSSGTTNIFTNYLSAVAPTTWGKKPSAAGATDGGPGAGTAINWPTGNGGKGSAGVAGFVTQAPYTIGYVEESYADQNNMQTALIKNKAGNWVKSNAATVSAAAAGATLPADLRAIIVNADGANAYPISGFTWALVYQRQAKADAGLALVRAFWWGTHDGQNDMPAGYSPLPAAAIALDEAQLAKITLPSGTPALPKDLLAVVKH